MGLLTATWKDGQVVLDAKPDWSDGVRLAVEEMPSRDEPFEFASESDQGNDPDSIEQWIDRVRQLPPLVEPGTEELVAITAWKDQVRQFNLAAVRAQFEGGN